MMKKRPFSRAGLRYDAIEAAALKTVSIKFVEGGLEDLSPSTFGSSNRSCLHRLPFNTDQSVCDVKFKFSESFCPSVSAIFTSPQQSRV